MFRKKNGVHVLLLQIVLNDLFVLFLLQVHAGPTEPKVIPLFINGSKSGCESSFAGAKIQLAIFLFYFDWQTVGNN